MSTFQMVLTSASRRESFDGVNSFVGSDASGQFGVLAHHARAITVLGYGLARFRIAGCWQHLALPGGVLSFRDNTLSIATRRYLRGDDYERISQALEDELRAEERRLGSLKNQLQQLEREMFRKLWALDRR